jgi:hypothetical protein
LPFATQFQTHAAGDAEISDLGLLRQRASHAQHHVLEHSLKGGGQIHVTLGEQLFGLAGRATEKVVELPIGHGQAGAIVEAIEIQAERAVAFDIDEMVEDGLCVARLAIWREPHHFVPPEFTLKPA